MRRYDNRAQPLCPVERIPQRFGKDLGATGSTKSHHRSLDHWILIGTFIRLKRTLKVVAPYSVSRLSRTTS